MTPGEESTVFAHRPPNETELTKFKLLLSTFQDGTGMQAVQDGSTLPGWRDFERAIALAVGGIPSENKDVMDVRVPDPGRDGVFFGISCKMKNGLNRANSVGRVYIELSNSAKAFWNRLGVDGISIENYRQLAPRAGNSVINLVREWHTAVSIEYGGNVDLSGSCYLTLSYNNKGQYQLHQFGIDLPAPASLAWYCPQINRKGVSQAGNSIRGDDDEGTVLEWFGESGGQLKYYPKTVDALWKSDTFKLEPLPPNTPHGLISKAEAYYPALWPK